MTIYEIFPRDEASPSSARQRHTGCTLDHSAYCSTPAAAATMPVLTRECLALKLRQNWLAKHPADAPAAPALDDSLTSLSWLQNLNIMKIASPTPPASPGPLGSLEQLPTAPLYTPQTQVNPNAVLNMGGAIKVKQEPGLAPPSSLRLPAALADIALPPAGTHAHPHALHDKIDYKTNPYVKPPYSYATLICMAMKETKKNKITLAGIYNWITDNFMYYRHADPSWQNSIRHNLSLNKCFQKVARRKDEPGKGGFWRINPEYEDMFINGIFKKRRAAASPLTAHAPLAKRFRLDVEAEAEDSDSSSVPASPVDTSPMLTSASPSFSVLARHKLPLTPQCSIEVKQEPRDFPAPAHAPTHEGDENSLDFNWNSILLQDIEVGGLKVKTEDIIDCAQDLSANPITAFSPPPSDSNSDTSIDDLLGNGELVANEFENPVDFESGQPLDLSINGMSLRPPEWWGDSFNETTKGLFAAISHSASGLHTPVIAQSPLCDNEDSFQDHPWAEDRSELDRAISSFDTDITNLFDLENIPSPALGVDS